MMTYYVDTNVFIYRSESKSEYFAQSKRFLDRSSNGEYRVTTSLETIQEIVHVYKRLGKSYKGILIAELILDLCEDLIDIDMPLIEKYLLFVEKYPSASSRDIIHLAACSYHGIRPVVTFDTGFRKFKEIKVLSPQEV